MATIIKQEVFGSQEQKMLATFMGWSIFEAMGRCAYLWNGSQLKKVKAATPAQIALWCGAKDEDEAFRIMNALASPLVGVLKRTKNGRFIVVGNHKQIQKLKQLKSNGAKGGLKTREKWGSGKDKQNPGQDAKPNAPASVEQMQGSFPLPTQPYLSLPSPSSPHPSSVAEVEHPSLEAVEANMRLIRERIDKGLEADGSTRGGLTKS